MTRRKGKTVKGARSGPTHGGEEEYKKHPHTFVINRGQVGKNVGHLLSDMRHVMEPYTASKLKVRKKSVLKDYVSIAGLLNVSHMMIFTKSESSTNMRLVRLPHGPTLTFRVQEYSLVRDVVSSLKRPNMEAKQFLHHPLLVMNNFSGDGHQIKLMTSMFQNMFPSINVNKIKLNTIRRCVLLNFNSETNTIDFRHYNIKAVPVGMSRGVKKLIKAKVPNMERYKDISDFLVKGGDLSESEAEIDGPHNEVVVPQDLGTRGNIKSSKSAIRLTEIGPRMSLQLVKIEEGVLNGQILYHEFVNKSEEEMKDLELQRAMKRKVREERKKIQAENVKRKAAELQRIKQKTLAGMRKEETEGDAGAEDPETKAVGDSEDDDVAYFTQEVGEEPDADLHISSGGAKKRKRRDQVPVAFKKRKAYQGKDQGKNKADVKGTRQHDRENKNTFSKGNKPRRPTTQETREDNRKGGKIMKKGGKFKTSGKFDKTDSKFPKGAKRVGGKGGKSFGKGSKSPKSRGKGRR